LGATAKKAAWNSNRPLSFPKANLKIYSLIKPQPEQRKEFYAEIPIQVRVKGQYHAVGRFFDDLAHLERIISVNGIQIEATSQETQCLATTFRFLDEAEANEVAESAKKGGKK
jgi:type IV pilus assembly protein PilO